MSLYIIKYNSALSISIGSSNFEINYKNKKKLLSLNKPFKNGLKHMNVLNIFLL